MSIPPGNRLNGLRLDLVVAAVLLSDTLVSGAAVAVGDGLAWYGWPLLAAGPLVFPLWRRYPRAVLLVTVGALVAVGHLHVGPLAAIPALVAIAVSMYRGHRRLTVSLVLLVSVATMLGNWTAAGFQFTGAVMEQSMLVIGWLHVALISGESRRQRDAYMAEAEHTREEAVKRKAADERVRIARELHDSLTHSISVIRVQAGVALHLARKRGEEPAPALVAVEEAAKDATRELRETLTMLRDDEGHRLSRVTPLADRYRGLGFAIDVDCEVDETVVLDEEVDHAAYRIVQEALTNAVRHSDGDRVRVRVRRNEDALVVEVADNGRARGFTPGRGLTGMRERADALGGTLDVGPGEFGFTVTACLPMPSTEPLIPVQAGAEPGGLR
ncbi:sensor histidine kinase [Glycomyces algeriensis]|uniref:histidine kinase n=1 Tax=Glycomyces algeriensis TaxID=256037 RepID=A0A9W6LG31_9ACTN|nr:sensor histidine kinase [Glycomyces algeriensis]MDA1367096.1 sensor histidine kinase [Glycomyces algeriensis]MDR7348517.1 signal transduction histidine kinase [Glycomyces algeriensis]GLI41221.1 two-component sensor histidine kinase [Glycomyces algeriensis]